jgi:phage tail-like protein
MSNEKSSQRKDPLPVFCFRVELSLKDGRTADAFFKSVSGLRSETEVVPVRVGGRNHTTVQLPGATKWSNIVLKNGFTGSSALLDWRNEWVFGTKRNRIGGTIIQLNTKLDPVAKWSFTGGWPCKWEISEFDASKSELAIETLEIAHDGLKFGG